MNNLIAALAVTFIIKGLNLCAGSQVTVLILYSYLFWVALVNKRMKIGSTARGVLLLFANNIFQVKHGSNNMINS